MKLRNILLINTLWLFGCDTLVQEISPDKIPQTEPKLVVGCFLNPDDTAIRVRVLTTIPVFGSEYQTNTAGVGTVSVANGDTLYLPAKEDIIDAEVKISNGTITTTLPYDVKEGVYKISVRDMPLKAGQSYSLTVNAKDGRKVSSTCTIPDKISIVSYKIDSAIVQGRGIENGKLIEIQGLGKFVTVNWQDPAGAKNFYEVSGYYQYTNTYTEGDKTKKTNGAALINFNGGGGRASFFDDKDQDGKGMTAPGGLIVPVGIINFEPTEKRTWLSSTVTKAVLAFSHVDANYLKYRKSIYDARNNNFFTEPTLVYSNIIGGYGCFGAYSTTFTEVYNTAK